MYVLPESAGALLPESPGVEYMIEAKRGMEASAADLCGSGNSRSENLEVGGKEAL